MNNEHLEAKTEAVVADWENETGTSLCFVGGTDFGTQLAAREDFISYLVKRLNGAVRPQEQRNKVVKP